MRKTTLLFLFAFTAIVAVAQQKKTSGNPIFPGWYADPDAAVFGSDYWIYPTFSAVYEKQTFLDAFSSKDLVNWKKHDKVLDTVNVKWAKKAVWAPAIVKKDAAYYLFFGANDIQNDNEIGGIGVAVSKSPSGPFKDHIGKPLVDKFHNGAQPIDQFVFKDKDGQYYLIYGGWSHCNIAKLSNDFKSLVPFKDGVTFKEITPEGYVEGPYMFIRNGKYYFMWSEGGWTGPDYSVAYAVADSPMGPFKRIGKILKQDPKIATGAGHHSIIHNEKKDAWYIVYHRRPISETHGNNRATCIDEMVFDENGLIQPIVITNEGVKAQKVN
ncbi:glycoside hydrolase family 43 protein [Pedobacter sp. MR2016-24]|uniref:glycoside hydrolase family 43 protein n=1 Tax=Pedobacter sp. MR2016-24 TaxID=2994466 RepID=UPI002248208D|nr:glycoside hydrolase family 43 protein [Pedobacter sp. MR2016-24]MCX2486539.1 glycoside hydrolase family 43 protein [Pedobacter sp. MR2016-24]